MSDDNNEGVITITLTLRPSRQGYALHVEVKPTDTFSDTTIEALHRAAKFFETRELQIGLVNIMEQVRAAREQQKRLIGPDGYRIN